MTAFTIDPDQVAELVRIGRASLPEPIRFDVPVPALGPLTHFAQAASGAANRIYEQDVALAAKCEQHFDHAIAIAHAAADVDTQIAHTLDAFLPH